MSTNNVDLRVDCLCGHAAAAHEHYRRGTDCSLCDCRRFRAAPVRPAGS